MKFLKNIGVLFLIVYFQIRITNALFWWKKFNYFSTPFPIITLGPNGLNRTTNSVSNNVTIIFQNTTANPAVTLVDPRQLTRQNLEDGVDSDKRLERQISFPGIISVSCSSIQPPCPVSNFIKPSKRGESTGYLLNGCPCTDFNSITNLLIALGS